MTGDPAYRIGHGYDAHRFALGRRLVLAGVTIPFERDGEPWGLDGHSDADAPAHAVIDALLGAAGLGDIGTHFPSSDDRWRAADSLTLLRHVAGLLARAGWHPGNVDVTVVAQAPRLAPHTDAMRRCLAGALAVPVERISVKPKTTDGMGFEGRGEGISSTASALLVRAST